MKRTPGPLPSSCLTCRRRKTQCDKARPACSRCLASGIACLGYNHIPTVEFPSFYESSSEIRSAIKPPHRHPNSQPLVDLPGILPSAVNDVSESIKSHGKHSQLLVSVNSREELPALDAPAQPYAQPRLELAKSIYPGQLSDEYPLSMNDNLAQPKFLSPSVSKELVDPAMFSRLPAQIIPDLAQSGEILEFIISQYGPLLEGVLFKPTSVLIETVRKQMTVRICTSSLARHSMYIGARIFQALTKDGKQADLRYLRSCLGRFGQQLWIKSANESTFDGVVDSLSAGLDLVFLYFVISNSQAGYTLLKNLIHTVLRVALSDFDLWSCQPNYSGISLVRALNPPHPGIYRFILLDALSSLTFGVPPLLEYDTSWPQLPLAHFADKTSPAVAAPELAPEFTMLIIKISVWRSRNPGHSAPEDIWKPIETEASNYQQNTDVPVGGETLQSITRMAIVEGWRHAILIYLYMGICSVASDDPRVQSSTKQIMRLLRVMGEDWNTRSHFFVPCLMASICTPSEKHRAKLSDAFLEVEDTKPWLFKAMEYKPVIDHLWHGAAANGRPVRWEDYVDSRRSMLRID